MTPYLSRYREIGYGLLPDGDWRAVWVDIESVNTGRLVTVVWVNPTTEPEPQVFTGTIYRTLTDVCGVKHC